MKVTHEVSCLTCKQTIYTGNLEIQEGLNGAVVQSYVELALTMTKAGQAVNIAMDSHEATVIATPESYRAHGGGCSWQHAINGEVMALFGL